MPPASPVRHRRLDAAKGVLIILVVLGHVLEAMASWDARATRLPLTAIYMFHMPAFVFLAGITAKTTGLVRRVGVLAVMLAAFQGLYFLAVQLLGVHRTFSLQAPFWILWFLLSLIWWYLLLPVVLRWPKLSTAAAVLLALAGGAVEWVDYTLSLSRTLVFLPFFVIGAAYGKRILAALPHLPAAAKPACGAVAVAAWLLLYKLRIDQGWLYGSEPFARLATPDLQGIAVRAGLLAVAAITTAGFMSLVPGRAGLLEAAGRRSLAVFVLHGFVVLSLRPYLRTILDSFGSVAASGIALLVTAVTVGIFTLPAFDAAIRKASQGIVVLVSGALERLRSRVAGHGSPDRSK